jgi:hypothetical protein
MGKKFPKLYYPAEGAPTTQRTAGWWKKKLRPLHAKKVSPPFLSLVEGGGGEREKKKMEKFFFF